MFLQEENRAEYQEPQTHSQLCDPGSGSAHWTSWSWKVQLLQFYQLRIQRPQNQPGHRWQLYRQPHHTGYFLSLNDFHLWSVLSHPYFVICYSIIVYMAVSDQPSESWARGKTSANHLVWHHGIGGKHPLRSSARWLSGTDLSCIVQDIECLSL